MLCARGHNALLAPAGGGGGGGGCAVGFEPGGGGGGGGYLAEKREGEKPYIICPYMNATLTWKRDQGRRKLFSIGPAHYGGRSRNLREGGGHPSCPARGYGGAL